MSRQPSSLFISILITAVAWCAGGCSQEEFHGVILSAWTSAELAAMPDTLILDEYVVVIDVSLNRDFMPVAPPDGRPLSAGVTLREVYQQALDYSIDDPTAFVVNGGAMWAVSLDPLSHIYHPNNEQPYSGWAGPKWGPGISVDVVMMFQDESGNVQRIIAREVNIDSSS